MAAVEVNRGNHPPTLVFVVFLAQIFHNGYIIGTVSRDAILCITFGFVAGVSTRSFFDFGAIGIILFLCLGAVAFGQSFLDRSERRLIWRAAAIFFLFIGLGILRFDLKDQSDVVQTINPTGSKVFSGLIVSEPDRRDRNTQLVFAPDHSLLKILLFVSPYPEFVYGDRLRIEGQLARIKNFEADAPDGGRSRIVPYANYLAVSEIYYEMFNPKVTLLERGQGNWLKSQLLGRKTIWLERLAEIVPEPEASLLAGLTLGARESLGVEWTERFRRAGLLHIVVLSGYNLSVVAAAILALLGFLAKRQRLIIAALAVALFTVMVGAGPATVRAAIMAIIALTAQATGRRYRVAWALGVAGFVMVVFNPKVLVFDPGFQLSFLATLGLITLAPKISSRLGFIKWSRKPRSGETGRELVAMTLSAQLAVFPWFLWHGIILSPLALPANLLVLPIVPLAMLFGFLTMFAPPLTGLIWLLAAPAFALAAYILGVAKLFS